MDQETTYELGRVQAHDLHSVARFDPVVIPFEGYCVCIGAHQAVVRDRDPVRVAAQIGQHGLGPAEGVFGIYHPVGFTQRCKV